MNLSNSQEDFDRLYKEGLKAIGPEGRKALEIMDQLGPVFRELEKIEEALSPPIKTTDKTSLNY